MQLKIIIKDKIKATEVVHQTPRLLSKIGRATARPRQVKPLTINVPENLKIKDNLGNYKPWFNGMKHFYSVKPIPPPPKKD